MSLNNQQTLTLITTAIKIAWNYLPPNPKPLIHVLSVRDSLLSLQFCSLQFCSLQLCCSDTLLVLQAEAHEDGSL